MLVGGGASCPGCNRSDSTARVSLLVHQIDGNLSPNEDDVLQALVQRGDATERITPLSGTWHDLSRKLAAPSMPQVEMTESAQDNHKDPLNTRGPAVYWTFLNKFGIHPVVGDPSLSNDIGPVILLIVFGILILGVYGVDYFWSCSFVLIVGAAWALYLIATRKKRIQKYSLWEHAKSKWDNLWYCARDNAVFLSGQRKLILVDRAKTFLLEP